MKKFIIPLVVILFAGAACWPFDGEETLAAMTLRSEGGKVQILRPDEDAITVGKDDVPVQPGDIVRTYSGGLAQIALEGDRVAWVGGRPQPTAGVPEAQMRIVSTSTVETDTGTVMAEAADPMKVRFGDAVASGSDSVFRVDRRAGAAKAATYSGTIKVTAPGEADVTLNRLYEVPATASDLQPTQPYRLNPGDRFDRRQLSDVIELERQLGQIQQGFITQLGQQKPSLPYFRAFAGNQDVDRMKRYLQNKTPAIDLLLGFTIAMNTKAFGFGDALDTAFEAHNDGGSWGVVAGIVRSDPKLLLADLNNIADASRVVAGGGGGPVFNVAAAENASLGSVPPPSVGGGGGDDDDVVAQPPPGGGGNNNNGNQPPPEEAEDCTSGPGCTVNDVVDDLPGGDGGEGDPEPKPSPSNLLDGFKPNP
jgi:hypothetical protein